MEFPPKVVFKRKLIRVALWLVANVDSLAAALNKQKATRTTVKPASSVTMKLNTQTKAPQWVSLQGMICI